MRWITLMLAALLALPALAHLTGLGRFSRLIAVRTALDKYHPMTTPHDYLFFLGVVPAAQGHGPRHADGHARGHGHDGGHDGGHALGIQRAAGPGGRAGA